MSIKAMGAVDATADTPINATEEDVVLNAEEIGKVAKVIGATVIQHTTVGLTECVLVW